MGLFNLFGSSEETLTELFDEGDAIANIDRDLTPLELQRGEEISEKLEERGATLVQLNERLGIPVE